jgi:hypothetical protein
LTVRPGPHHDARAVQIGRATVPEEAIADTLT